MKTNQEKSKLIIILIFKYLIPIIFFPIIIIIIFSSNIVNKMLIASLVLLATGVNAYFFNIQCDIVFILFGLLNIIIEILFHNKIEELLFFVLYVALILIFVIDIIRLIIYYINKGKKLIKSKDNIEILHYLFHCKLLKN